MLQFYESQLLVLISVCGISLLLERYGSRLVAFKCVDDDRTPATNSTLATLARQYLIVYAIVMGADWLQGPYVYSLYRDQYGFEERFVAILFVTGFMSAGFSAPWVGAWADQYGRKAMCMMFCITYTLTCVCLLIPWLPILLVGRLLGGISTAILFSAFESWLISSSTSLALSQSDLSTILGRATLVNGFVATGAGVLSNKLVSFTHSFASPFIASAALLVLGWVVIRGIWTENYGGGGGLQADSDVLQLKRLGKAWKLVYDDPILLVLGLTQTCFEGSMYLFVFLWVPLLQEASKTYPVQSLPLGYIFSSFMISMMLGSVFYTFIVNQSLSPKSSKSTHSPRVLHAKLSSMVCAVSALALTVAVNSSKEEVRFWAFCAFEACVGMYYPVQGMLRGTFVSNEHRATLSSLFRVPLNVFVVVSLLTGVSTARYTVLSFSSSVLAISSVLTGLIIVPRADDEPPAERTARV